MRVAQAATAMRRRPRLRGGPRRVTGNPTMHPRPPNRLAHLSRCRPFVPFTSARSVA
ncbi:hypothetical protein BURMUCGD1_4786 [Burkholderia multivorans CGD1]|nr:hypothetical protein BURMUCGD1_4786 [Burkholderia multivorans CGD1]